MPSATMNQDPYYSTGCSASKGIVFIFNHETFICNDNQYPAKSHPRHGGIIIRVLHELWSSATNILNNMLQLTMRFDDSHAT